MFSITVSEYERKVGRMYAFSQRMAGLYEEAVGGSQLCEVIQSVIETLRARIRSRSTLIKSIQSLREFFFVCLFVYCSIYSFIIYEFCLFVIQSVREFCLVNIVEIEFAYNGFYKCIVCVERVAKVHTRVLFQFAGYFMAIK